MTVLALLASDLTGEQQQKAVYDALVYALVLIFGVSVAAAAGLALWDWWLTPPCPYTFPVTIDGQPCLCRRRAGHRGEHRCDPFTDTTPLP